MKKINCPKFHKCNAPLCPLDPESIQHGIWYPDEDICTKRNMHTPWLKKQKRIKKLLNKNLIDPNLFFSVSMLNKIKAVRPGLKGANPDIPNSEKIWLSKRG